MISAHARSRTLRPRSRSRLRLRLRLQAAITERRRRTPATGSASRRRLDVVVVCVDAAAELPLLSGGSVVGHRTRREGRQKRDAYPDHSSGFYAATRQPGGLCDLGPPLLTYLLNKPFGSARTARAPRALVRYCVPATWPCNPLYQRTEMQMLLHAATLAAKRKLPPSPQLPPPSMCGRSHMADAAELCFKINAVCCACSPRPRSSQIRRNPL